MEFTDYINLSFVDHDPEVINSLVSEFKSQNGCKFKIGDIFSINTGGTLVSPSNCFGNMDGGIDRVYSDLFPSLEEKLKTFIDQDHGGKLEFGQAQIVPNTDSEKYPLVIFSPTIERPGDLSSPSKIYSASKAIFTESLKYNLKGNNTIKNLIIPGMGTMYGGISPQISAREVHRAYLDVSNTIRNSF
ncbi:MAG: macro domain-containing protein [Nanoarchaeota archaeon]|nr:macro domain-containing protein [Nanoarchaeota archaeon]MEC8339235.1 macro domain-containing protein [Nanoarchaeota archaeon]